MNKITENNIELLAIDLLEEQGWHYCYGPDIAPDGDGSLRTSFADVVLMPKLMDAVGKLNPDIPRTAREQAIRELAGISSPDLINNNEKFHGYLTDGIDVEFQVDGRTRGGKVWLIDFDNPDNNDFMAVNQFTIIENNNRKRPDIILFVNGLPLVVIELKNPADENATVKKAFHQLQAYKTAIPSLFNYNEILIVSDGFEAKAGSLSADYSRFLVWKTTDGRTEASVFSAELETMIRGMLGKSTILDLIRHFIVYEKSSHTGRDGLTIVQTVKKLAAYHQYYAVNDAVKSTVNAASENGDMKAGVVWHTQGSGKSLSMVFYTGKLVLALNNPTVVVITDRNDLDDQLFNTFAECKQLLRQKPVQADNRDQLKELLKVSSGGIVFTTIQKFSPEDGNVYEQLSERRNIVVIADEAHRTQYGFAARTVDDIDQETREVVGKKIVYGFAKYMRDALPRATYIGFTGTPIEKDDKNTPAVFGNYIHIYDIAQAVEDGATVRIYYESRLAKVNLDNEARKLIDDLDRELEAEDLTVTQKIKIKWTKLEAIIGSDRRIGNVARDIVRHFEIRQEAFEGKAMIVAMSRRIAVKLYDEITRLRPDWHDDDRKKGAVKVVMTSSSADGAAFEKHHTTKQQRRELADRMKDPADPLKIVIVRDMWLTGFDVPCLHTLYIDKPMRGHNLMQAIARVNRVYKDKEGGLIVDYLGIASDLRNALAFYSDSGGRGDPALAQEQAVDIMLEKIEVVNQLFHGYAYDRYFTAATSEKLKMILEAEEHILGLENGKERLIREVTALSRVFAIALPHDLAMENKDRIAFFQAVKARLAKFEPAGSGRSDEEIETAIRQVVDKAIVSDKAVDIFDAAGIQKPDITILSDEFMEEIKGMQHKNLALEVLKKILNDEIRSRSKHNLVKSRSLMEMLEDSIRRYQNQVLSAAEVIQELIALAKEIRQIDERGKSMNMTEDELAFYDAVSNNRSAKDVLGDEVLRKLAIVLVERVRKNATIDWTIKESVRAKLKVIVRRTLRKYGYPPDLQAMATEVVLEQAEMLAEFWAA